MSDPSRPVIRGIVPRPAPPDLVIQRIDRQSAPLPYALNQSPDPRPLPLPDPQGMSCQRVALRLRARAASAATPAGRHFVFTPQTSPLRAVAFLAHRRPAWQPASRAALQMRLHASSATATEPAAAPLSKADVVDVLKERGLLDACTNEDELRKACAEGSLSVYCGFDPTADSLHLGNLLGIVVLAWFQRCGHTPVALLGGATGRVGDPSGKSAERPVLDDDTINANTAGIKAILERVLANGAAEGEMIDPDQLV